MSSPRLQVSLGLWQDRPPQEALTTAALADELGYGQVWIGEMATYDAFALATRVGVGMTRAGLVVGPLAVTVRDPMMIAMGAASVAALTGRPVSVGLGASSPTVVGRWHGRSYVRTGQALQESAQALRVLLSGERAESPGQVVSTSGYRLRLPPPGSELVVAAFGPRAVRTAAAYADRMVLNLVTPTEVARLTGRLEACARELGRPSPPVAVWVPAALDADAAAVDQLRRAAVGYLAAPGYAEMFAAAGFGDLVAYARTGPPPGELLARVPAELTAAVGLLGDEASIAARIAAYAEAGAHDVVLVPASTDADPAGERTLRALAPA